MQRTVILVSLLILLAMIFWFCGTASAQTIPTSSRGSVVGTVMDQRGSVILLPRPIVVFEKKNRVTETVVDERGQFRITLPTGTYNITTRIPGFYPFRRSKFNLIAGETVMINVIPTPQILDRGTTVSAKESIDRRVPLPKFDEVLFFPKSVLRGVIQFVAKRNVDGEITYEDAVFSYDNVTVYADKLRLNRKALRLRASGPGVIFEDGNERKEVSSIIILFKEGKLFVDVTGQVQP